MRSISLAGLAVSVLLSAAACSGGDGDAVPTSSTDEPAATVTSAPTTTEPPDSTSTTSTFESTTTTAESTTTTTVAETSTTAAPPTSTTLPEGVPPRLTFPDDPDKQAVVDSVYQYLDALSLASAAPADATLRADVGRWVVDPVAPRVFAFLDELLEQNQRVLPNTTAPWFIRMLEPTIEVVGDAATLDACVFDSDLRVKLAAAPDGSDEVLDDSVVSSFQTFVLVRADGVWRVRDISEFGRFEDENRCE